MNIFTKNPLQNSCAILLTICSITLASGQSDVLKYQTQNDQLKESNSQLKSLLSGLTPSFRENKGQWPEEIIYRGGAGGARVSFLKDQVVYTFTRSVEEQHSEEYALGREGGGHETMVWNTRFEGMNPAAQITSAGNTGSKFNYIVSDNGNPKHVTDAQEVALVQYNDVYEKTTVRYYKTEFGELKYDFVLLPGAKVTDIKLRTEGVEKLNINRKGELEVKTPWGTLLEKAPFSYQFIDGIKKEVDVRYELLDHTAYGYKIYGEYDAARPLIIDPVVLQWNTYVGDQVNDRTTGYVLDVFVDNDGYTYGAGWYSDDFTTTPGTYQDKFGGYPSKWPDKNIYNVDMIVFKLKPDASDLEFGTYVGGKDFECGWGITVDDKGDIYVAGKVIDDREVAGTNYFPTTANAFDRTYNGGITDDARPFAATCWGHGGDVAVFKLSGSGDKLIYSTLVGGAKSEQPTRGIEVNDKGEVFVAGATQSKDFPTTTGAYQENYNGGECDGFVFKLNADGSDLIYSTFIGGSDKDFDYGTTIYNPFDRQLTGGFNINNQGEVFFAGSTASADFPTSANAFQSALLPPNPYNGPYLPIRVFDAFLVRLNDKGTDIIYSTLIGGGSWDRFTDVVVDDQNNAYACGETMSEDFPTTAGVAFPNLGKKDGYNPRDAMIVKMNPTGTQLIWSTFLGGNRNTDVATSIDLNYKNEVFVVGETTNLACACLSTSDFPVTNCAQHKTALSDGVWGKGDIFLSKLSADASTLLYSTYYGGDSYDYQPKVVVWSPYPCMENVTMSYDSHSNDLSYPKPVYMNSCSQIWPGASYDCPQIVHFRPEVNTDFSFSNAKCGDPVQFTDLTQPSNCMWQDGPWNPSSWHWDFGDGSTSTEKNPGHLYAASGTYKVVLTIGCPGDTVSKVVTFPSGTGSFDLGPNRKLCPGKNVTLSVGSQPAGTTVKWSTGATTKNISVSKAGKYWVELGDGSCPVVDTVEVLSNSLNMTVTSKSATCAAGGSATAEVSGDGPFQYQWDDPRGQVTKTATDLDAGTYNVQVTDANGCAISESVSIGAATGTVQATVSGIDAKCGSADGSATAQASGGSGNYTYKWSNGATTASVTGLAPGVYEVVVSDDNGCTITKEIAINAESSVVAYVPEIAVKGCDRQGAVNAEAIVYPSGGTEPYSYLWNDSRDQTTQTATGLAVGNYQVIVTDANGCSDTGYAVIEEVLQIDIEVLVDPCESGCTDGEVTAHIGGTGQPPYTYRWDDPDAQTTATATGLAPGVYTISVTDDEGCRNTGTVAIGGAVGVDELKAKALKVYPNPSDGVFRIALETSGSVELRVRDIRGKQLLIKTYENMLNQLAMLDLSGYSEGVYLLELISEQRTMYGKIQLLR